MIWQTLPRGRHYSRGAWSGPSFVRSLFTVASGAIVIVSTFWCSLTSLSALSGGGDVEDLDND
jgi:hypothetical protein